MTIIRDKKIVGRCLCRRQEDVEIAKKQIETLELDRAGLTGSMVWGRFYNLDEDQF